PLLIVKSIPVIKDIPKVKVAINHSILLPLFAPISAPFDSMVKNTVKEKKEEIMKRLQLQNTDKKTRSKDDKLNETKGIMNDVGGGLGNSLKKKK
ncbi:MAG: hypothetical protein H7263_10860, partial [Candidatus Sericytochromatia bacterium]|nr:hypothetical protein [Candidatus Sericytochromatia bacterium]